MGKHVDMSCHFASQCVTLPFARQGINTNHDIHGNDEIAHDTLFQSVQEALKQPWRNDEYAITSFVLASSENCPKKPPLLLRLQAVFRQLALTSNKLLGQMVWAFTLWRRSSTPNHHSVAQRWDERWKIRDCPWSIYFEGSNIAKRSNDSFWWNWICCGVCVHGLEQFQQLLCLSPKWVESF